MDTYPQEQSVADPEGTNEVPVTDPGNPAEETSTGEGTETTDPDAEADNATLDAASDTEDDTEDDDEDEPNEG